MINTNKAMKLAGTTTIAVWLDRPPKKPTRVALLIEDLQEEQLLGGQVYDAQPLTPEAAFTPEGKELLRLVEESRLLCLGQTAVTEVVSNK